MRLHNDCVLKPTREIVILVVELRRWVVERTSAWLENAQYRFSCDYE